MALFNWKETPEDPEDSCIESSEQGSAPVQVSSAAPERTNTPIAQPKIAPAPVVQPAVAPVAPAVPKAAVPSTPTGPSVGQRLSMGAQALADRLRRVHRSKPSSSIPSVAPEKQALPQRTPAWGTNGWTGLALWVIGVAYCGAELLYNRALVELFSAPSVSLSTFEDIETLGKTLAAFGLSLFVSRWWRPRVALPLFALCFPLLFVGIGQAYDKAIDALPQSAKTAGYYLGAYRNLVVNGDLNNPTLWDPIQGANAEQKILLTNMALIPYSGVDSGRTVLDWMYGSDRDVRGELQANVDTLYLGYASVMGKLEPFYAKYAIESRRWTSLKDGMFKNMYAKEFTRVSGGVPPGLNKVQFYDKLRQTNPALAQFHDAVIIEPVPKLGVGALRMGDIPPFSTQEQFDKVVFDHIQSASARARSGADDVTKNPQAKRIIAAAYVPSISMALSLISLLLNVSLLLAAPVRAVLTWVAPASIAFAGSALVSLGAFWVLWMQPVAPISASMAQMLSAPTGITGMIWERTVHVQWNVMQHTAPVGHLVATHLVDRTRTESYERLNIQKVQPVALGNLEERMELLERHQTELLAAQQQLPVLDRDVVIDTERLERDPSYFGERKPTGPNPYLKKPKE